MTSFTDTFSAGTINPAQPGYIAYNITANLTLQWPVETVPATNVVAAFMDMTTTAGLSVIMPPANSSSTGVACIFSNIGANSFTVKSNVANTVIATVASGTAWIILLTGNATADGTWESFQLASVTSSTIAANLAGLGIKAITTTLNQDHPATTQAVSRTLVAADRAQLIEWTGGAGTLTLDVVANLVNGWFTMITNQGTGSVNITPQAPSLVNGVAAQAPLIMQPADTAFIVSDGTNFFSVGFGRVATFQFDFIQISLAGVSGSFTLTGNQLNRISYRFTGLLAGNANIIAPSTVAVYFGDNQTTGAFTLGIETAVQTLAIPTIPQLGRGIYTCDGTNVVNADTSGFATPLPIASGGTGASTATGAQTNLDVPNNRTVFMEVMAWGR